VARGAVDHVQVAVAHPGRHGADQHLAARRLVDLDGLDGHGLVDPVKDRGADLHADLPWCSTSDGEFCYASVPLSTTRAAIQATTTIPVLMTVTGDPVAAGLVRDLARPGGNLTGASFFFPRLATNVFSS
jgi:hypothetical protein